MQSCTFTLLSSLLILQAGAAAADVEVELVVSWSGTPSRTDFKISVDGEPKGYRRLQDGRIIVSIEECTSETEILLDPVDPFYAPEARDCVPTPVEFQPTEISWLAMMRGEGGDRPPYAGTVLAALASDDLAPASRAPTLSDDLKPALLDALETDDFEAARNLAGQAADYYAAEQPDLSEAYGILAADAGLRAAGREPLTENLIIASAEGQESFWLTKEAVEVLGSSPSGVAVVEGDEEMAMAGPVVERAGYDAVPPSKVDVESLTGLQVYGMNDEDIGEVSDLVVGASGEIESIVVEVGGFLGLGQKPVSVDFDELGVLRERGGEELRVYIDATEEELESMENYAE